MADLAFHLAQPLLVGENTRASIKIARCLRFSNVNKLISFFSFNQCWKICLHEGNGRAKRLGGLKSAGLNGRC